MTQHGRVARTERVHLGGTQVGTPGFKAAEVYDESKRASGYSLPGTQHVSDKLRSPEPPFP